MDGSPYTSASRWGSSIHRTLLGSVGDWGPLQAILGAVPPWHVTRTEWPGAPGTTTGSPSAPGCKRSIDKLIEYRQNHGLPVCDNARCRRKARTDSLGWQAAQGQAPAFLYAPGAAGLGAAHPRKRDLYGASGTTGSVGSGPWKGSVGSPARRGASRWPYPPLCWWTVKHGRRCRSSSVFGTSPAGAYVGTSTCCRGACGAPGAGCDRSGPRRRPEQVLPMRRNDALRAPVSPAPVHPRRPVGGPCVG